MSKFMKYYNALTFVVKNYNGLKRKSSNIPYMVHPLRVASILRAVGFLELKHEDLMIAALFHDLIEDTDVSKEEIGTKFGNEVASIVEEVSKPESLDKEDWLKTFNNASKEAKIIKMADRIDNLIDMDKIDWFLERKKLYAEHGKIIAEKCGDAHLELRSILLKRVKKVLNSL
ncbi:MAG: HD domain-containing protein [Promethearchaeota archaeon]